MAFSLAYVVFTGHGQDSRLKEAKLPLHCPVGSIRGPSFTLTLYGLVPLPRTPQLVVGFRASVNSFYPTLPMPGDSTSLSASLHPGPACYAQSTSQPFESAKYLNFNSCGKSPQSSVLLQSVDTVKRKERQSNLR